MKQLGIIVTAVAIGLAAVPVIAQRPADGAPIAKGPLTRAALEAMIRERFTAIDSDRSGAVSVAEWRAHANAKRAERRSAMFARLDADGSGSISRSEFDAAGDQRQRRGAGRWGGNQRFGGNGGAGRFARVMWGRADADGDAQVTLAEALAMPMAMFDRADTNKDGTLSAEERIAAREAFRANRQSR